jgi:hypothetical protein
MTNDPFVGRAYADNPRTVASTHDVIRISQR